MSRTLRRPIQYRPIEAEDVKYLWAAYKQGGLEVLGIKAGLSPDEFREAFEALVMNNCHAAWTLFAQTRRGVMPVGVIMGAWAPGGSYLIVMAVVWLPWATKRNIVECCVGFFSGTRKDFTFVGYALPDHKRMYEVCAMHGVMRRVGTSYIVIPGQHVAVFESRPA